MTQAKLWTLLAKIPAGKVATYQQLATLLKTSPRVVGNWLHGNIDPANYPCHRVVKSDGRVASGYAFGGRAAQEKRLLEEGVLIVNDRVNLDKYLVPLDYLK